MYKRQDEAKFGKAQLGKTDDGKQMSDDWLLGSVTGNNRILDAVDAVSYTHLDVYKRQHGYGYLPFY